MLPQGNDHFYQELPALNTYQEAIRSKNLSAVPEDWILILTDIIGSTKAIEQGKYKEVNVLGASCIVSVINLNRELKIPYAFGGDGATILIPATWEKQAREVLAATRQTAEQTFHMGLRVMFIPVKELNAHGKRLFVSKFKLSPSMNQAVIHGDGLSYAEGILRTVEGDPFLVKHDPVLCEADYSGLECRWQPVTSNHGKMVSLLVRVKDTDTKEQDDEYDEIYTWIQNKFKESRPITKERMNLAKNPDSFKAEVMMKNGEDILWTRLFMLFLNYLGNLFEKIGRIGDVDWKKFFNDVVHNSDSLKFDGMMRMILDLSEDQVRELRAYLEEKYQQGKLVYGLHVSNQAQMTCLVFNRTDDHIHFVDGTNGGYALAAKQMKSQYIAKV